MTIHSLAADRSSISLDLERWIHLNMTFIGGFIGGFAILNYHDLFGSAQTANMISLALHLGGNPDNLWPLRIGGVGIYILGIVLPVIFSKVLSHSTLKLCSIFLDMAALITVAFLPPDTNFFLCLYPLFLATAFQWCCFNGADGYNSSCIFSTNNLRQCTSSFMEYFISHNKKSLHKGIFFGKVLLVFHTGAFFAGLICLLFGTRGALAGLIPAVFAIVLIELDR